MNSLIGFILVGMAAATVVVVLYLVMQEPHHHEEHYIPPRQTDEPPTTPAADLTVPDQGAALVTSPTAAEADPASGDVTVHDAEAAKIEDAEEERKTE